MSAPPVAVTIVDYSGGEETITGQAVFDDVDEALDAIDLLMRFWSFDEHHEHRIEVQRA